MSVQTAGMILVLWRDGRFDTFDIATALSVHEADVCRVIHAVRGVERWTA